MTHACFTVIASGAGAVLIRDDCVSGCPSLTNDAEYAVEKMHEAGLLKGKRLLYVDSDGRTDELLHDGNGVFKGFGPVRADDVAELLR